MLKKETIYLKLIIGAVLLVSVSSCKKISQKSQSVVYDNFASFDWFEYKGKDDAYTAKSDSEYLNPILAGFYPDPTICRVENKFYLVNSSFCYFPGLPIFESPG